MQNIGTSVDLTGFVRSFEDLAEAQTGSADDAYLTVGFSPKTCIGTVLVIFKIGSLDLQLRFNEDVMFIL